MVAAASTHRARTDTEPARAGDAGHHRVEEAQPFEQRGQRDAGQQEAQGGGQGAQLVPDGRHGGPCKPGAVGQRQARGAVRRPRAGWRTANVAAMPSDAALKIMNGVHRAVLKLSFGKLGWQRLRACRSSS